MVPGKRYRKFSFVFLSAIFVLAGCSSNEPVDQPAEVPDVVETVKFKTLWNVSVGDGHDGKYLHLQPTLMDESLYAASADGELVSVNPENGKVNWRRDLDQTIMAGVGADPERLYLVSENANLLTFDGSSGEALWQASLPNEVIAPPQSNGSLVVAQTIDGKVLGFDAATGEKRWQYDGVVPVLTLRGSAAPVVGSEIVLASLASGQLFALSTETGQPQWQYTIGEAKGRTELERLVDITAEPVIVDSAALVVGYKGKLAAVDLRNGEEIWSRSMSSLRSPAIAYGNIFVAEANGTVTALQGQNRQSVWSQDQLRWRQLTRPVATEDYLLVGDFEGYIHALSLLDGTFAGQTKFSGDGLRVPFLRWQDQILVYGNGGKLAAIQLVKKD
ncbi:MAG: outer membrane protein assembly factor BamB [Oleiphilaceae bacterium]|nr:outer membrane protein assembly factor BamB [Oleiphilaceae bacterium]